MSRTQASNMVGLRRVDLRQYLKEDSVTYLFDAAQRVTMGIGTRCCKLVPAVIKHRKIGMLRSAACSPGDALLWSFVLRLVQPAEGRRS